MPREQREPREGYVAVGRVVRPWGLRGDVKVESLTDFSERFEVGSRLWVGGVHRTIQHSRSHKGDIYLKVSGIDSPEAAETLRDELIEIAESELQPLPEGDYYHFQLQGLAVRTVEGETLGSVTEVLSPGGNAVLVVHGDRGEILLPFIDQVIRTVDLDARVIAVELMEGLLPEPPRRPAAPAGQSSTVHIPHSKSRRTRRRPPSPRA